MDEPLPTGGLGSRPPAPLVIAGQSFTSRLVMGTGGAASLEALEQALVASGTELTTVALRRTSPGARGSILDVLRRGGGRAVPHTPRRFPPPRAPPPAQPAPGGVGSGRD